MLNTEHQRRGEKEKRRRGAEDNSGSTDIGGQVCNGTMRGVKPIAKQKTATIDGQDYNVLAVTLSRLGRLF